MGYVGSSETSVGWVGAKVLGWVGFQKASKVRTPSPDQSDPRDFPKSGENVLS